jgi:hypothetical protein
VLFKQGMMVPLNIARRVVCSRSFAFWGGPLVALGAAALLATAPDLSAQAADADQPKDAGKEAAKDPAKDSAAYTPLSLFAKALQLIRQDYVDEAKVSYSALIGSALKGMLSSLDPHSQFLEPKDYRAVQDDTRSRFSGVGVVLTQKEGRLVVIDFERIEGKSREWTLKHIRAGREVFQKEIETAGFKILEHAEYFGYEAKFGESAPSGGVCIVTRL